MLNILNFCSSPVPPQRSGTGAEHLALDDFAVVLGARVVLFTGALVVKLEAFQQYLIMSVLESVAVIDGRAGFVEQGGRAVVDANAEAVEPGFAVLVEEAVVDDGHVFHCDAFLSVCSLFIKSYGFPTCR